MKDSIFSTLFIIFSAVGLLTGCAASGPKQYAIRADAEPMINRDATGQPLSVVLRIYQLKQPTEFSLLTFDLAASGRSDAELLGNSLVQKDELVLVPGEQFVDKETLAPDAKYLGIVALFRRPDANFWRFLIDAEQVRKKGLNLVVQDCFLSLKQPSASPIPGQPLDAKPVCRVDDPFSNKRAMPASNAATPNASRSVNTEKTGAAKTKSAHSANKRAPVEVQLAPNSMSANVGNTNVTATSSGTAIALPPSEIRLSPNVTLGVQ